MKNKKGTNSVGYLGGLLRVSVVVMVKDRVDLYDIWQFEDGV